MHDQAQSEQRIFITRQLPALRRGCALIAILCCAPLLSAQEIKLISGSINPANEKQASLESLKQDLSAAGEAMALIQFTGPVQGDWIEECRAAGVELRLYLPDYAYISTFKPEKLSYLRGRKDVRWVGALPVNLRVHPDLRQSDGAELAVTILSLDMTPAQFLRNNGIEVKSTRKTQMGWQDTRATIPAGQLDAIAALWGVFLLEPQPVYELHGERGAQTAAGNYPPAGTAPTGPGYTTWLSSHGLSGAPGVIIQVQDDGLDQGNATNNPGTAHPDILGRIAGIFNATADALGDSRAGHGQINAGIIMGNATVGTMDTAGFKLGQGLAPLALVYATKIFRNSGFFDIGGNSFTTLAKNAQDAGARYSSNSWGASVGGAYNADSAEFDALVRDADTVEAGLQQMTYFFSAGNSGPSANTTGAPGTAKNVITVGAGENSDADGTDGCGVPPTGANSIRDLINFSSRGPNDDGRLGVTLFSVGTHVQGPVSTAVGYDGSGVCDQFWPPAQTNYARSSGTSHSCPTAAGAGLIVHEFLILAGLAPAGGPSPALMKAILTNTATDMAGGNDGNGGTLAPVPNPNQGWGSVNLSTLVDHDDKIVVLDQQTVFDNSSEFFEVLITTVNPALPLKITLAWTDAPGVPAASPALVNDLDLVVTGNSMTYLGNVFSGGFSSTGGSADRLNNLEAVFIQNPTGTYTVRVNAFNIPGNGLPGIGDSTDQDFALFVWNGTDQSSAGIVRFDREYYNCSDTVEVLVSDLDLQGSGTVTVSLSSSTSDVESLLLNESGVNTGVFLNQILTATGAATSDGLLQVLDGGTISAVYNDADDGSGNPAVTTTTATIDCTSPVISNVQIVNIGKDRFTVTFNTNEPATGLVRIGATCGASLDTEVSGLGTAHSVTFTGLSVCTPYRVQVEATDRAGNLAIDDNSGNCYIAVTFDVTTQFSDDFEPTALAGWTHSAIQGSDNWAERVSGNAHSPTHVYSYEPGTFGVSDARLVSPAFTGGGELSFWHTFEMDLDFDGGVLEITTNGGGSWQDLGPFIEQGGYNGTIVSGVGNPLGGREGWVNGALSAMTQVVVNLSTFPGTVQVRWRFGSDTIIESTGWLIDDVVVDTLADCLSNQGVLRFDRTAYGCGDLLQLEVLDLNGVAGSVPVELITSAGDLETVNATDPNSDKIYQASIAISASGTTVTMGDGILQGFDLDVIMGSYDDNDDGAGGMLQATDSADLDCVFPVISNVNIINIGGFEATVTFETNEPATGLVRFGTSCGALTQTQPISTPAINHQVLLDGLEVTTTYYLRIEMQDAAGNPVIDDNGGSCYSFTTIFQADYFTEQYAASDNDLDGLTLMLTPSVSPNSYTACTQLAFGYPVDPAGGTVLPLSDDDFELVNLSGGAQVNLYGTAYGSFYVGSNGYVTFGSGDSNYFETLSSHFNQPRISGLFNDLFPSGNISWKQLANQAVVTYDNVSEYSNLNSNNFQMQLFFNGEIHVTWLGIDATGGISGISAGLGLPPDFLESNLDRYDTCSFSSGPPLSISTDSRAWEFYY